MRASSLGQPLLRGPAACPGGGGRLSDAGHVQTRGDSPGPADLPQVPPTGQHGPQHRETAAARGGRQD